MAGRQQKVGTSSVSSVVNPTPTPAISTHSVLIPSGDAKRLEMHGVLPLLTVEHHALAALPPEEEQPSCNLDVTVLRWLQHSLRALVIASMPRWCRSGAGSRHRWRWWQAVHAAHMHQILRVPQLVDQCVPAAAARAERRSDQSQARRFDPPSVANRESRAELLGCLAPEPSARQQREGGTAANRRPLAALCAAQRGRPPRIRWHVQSPPLPPWHELPPGTRAHQARCPRPPWPIAHQL